MKNKSAVLFIQGGLGRQIMQTTIANELADQYTKVYTFCHYIDDCKLAVTKPNIEVFDYGLLPSMSATIMNDPDSYDIFKQDVYSDSEFMKRNASFYNTARKLCNIKPVAEDNNPEGQITMPLIDTTAYVQQAAEFAAQHPNFVLFCRQGGMSYLPGPDGTRQPTIERGLLRSYPIAESERLCKLLFDAGIEVLQVCLPEEPHIANTISMQEIVPMAFYAELAKYAKAVITIDSSLLHFTVATANKQIVIWRETPCKGFGYIKSINLQPINYKPITMLLQGTDDSPICNCVAPEDIFKLVVEHEKVD